MPQLPGCGLGIHRVEVLSEELGVSEMPQSAGIISHTVQGARNKVVACHIAMRALVQGVEAQEVGASTGRGCRPFDAHASKVRLSPAIHKVRSWTWRARASTALCAMVPASSRSEIERERATRVRGGDQGALDVGRKTGAPHDRGRGWVQHIKPHAAHANSSGVARASVGWCHWHQLAEACWPGGKGVGKSAKVRDCVKDMLIQSDTMSVAPAEGLLKYREQTA